MKDYRRKYKKYRNRYNIARRGGMSSPSISYFFDNDINNFHDSEICPHAIPVQICESTEQQMTNNQEAFSKYLSILGQNARLYGLTMNSLDEGDGYDMRSGITIDQINHYKNKVIKNSPSSMKAYIFDWDRTLTVFEGIYAIQDNIRTILEGLNLANIKTAEVGEYYFGGNERVNVLKELWKTLINHGIEIWVLSSNPSIGRHPKFFLDLLESLDLPVDPDKLIYRGELTKYQYIKKYIHRDEIVPISRHNNNIIINNPYKVIIN